MLGTEDTDDAPQDDPTRRDGSVYACCGEASGFFLPHDVDAAERGRDGEGVSQVLAKVRAKYARRFKRLFELLDGSGCGGPMDHVYLVHHTNPTLPTDAHVSALLAGAGLGKEPSVVTSTPEAYEESLAELRRLFAVDHPSRVAAAGRPSPPKVHVVTEVEAAALLRDRFGSDLLLVDRGDAGELRWRHA